MQYDLSDPGAKTKPFDQRNEEVIIEARSIDMPQRENDYTGTARRRNSVRKFRHAAVLLGLFACHFWYPLIVSAQEEEDDDDDPEKISRIEELRQKVRVDFDGKLSALDDSSLAASLVMDRIGDSLRKRMEGLFEMTKTTECRQKISEHFGYFINAIGLEESLPFADVHFNNECGEEVYIWKDLPEDVNPW